MLFSTIVTMVIVFAIALFSGVANTLEASIAASLAGMVSLTITRKGEVITMTILNKASEWLKALNSRTVGYVWFILSTLLINVGINPALLEAIGGISLVALGGVSLMLCLVVCISGQGDERSWSNYRQHGWEGGNYKEDDQPISDGVILGFIVSLCYYLVVVVVLHHVWGMFDTVLPGYIALSAIVGIFTSRRLGTWIKALPFFIVVLLVVGCSDDEHGMRMKALNDEGYPGYCQRDTNHDGWYTLVEGAEVLYKDLGPCPTCKKVGVTPIYNSTSDSSWTIERQLQKQALHHGE
jgi:ABC-type amino acid transport system permease subunit